MSKIFGHLTNLNALDLPTDAFFWSNIFCEITPSGAVPSVSRYMSLGVPSLLGVPSGKSANASQSIPSASASEPHALLSPSASADDGASDGGADASDGGAAGFVPVHSVNSAHSGPLACP